MFPSFIACSNHYISYFKEKQKFCILDSHTLNALKNVHRIMDDKRTRPAVKRILRANASKFQTV